MKGIAVVSSPLDFHSSQPLNVPQYLEDSRTKRHHWLEAGQTHVKHLALTNFS